MVTKACRFCAEDINAEAVVCKHCGRLSVEPELERLAREWGNLEQKEREARWVELWTPQQERLRATLDVLANEVVPRSAVSSSPPVEKKRSGRVTWGCLGIFAIFILLSMIGDTFSKRQPTSGTPASALDEASASEILLLGSPFQRPFQYIGMPLKDAAVATGGTPNQGSNIIVEAEQARLFLESDGNFVSYVEVSLLSTAPCRLDREFDSESVLGALSINLSELELARRQTHFHTYYDHRRKLRISVTCDYDGGPLTAGFGSRYYGM